MSDSVVIVDYGSVVSIAATERSAAEAASSATDAASSASAAATSETNAAASATIASTQANVSATSAAAASESATNAATSETNAAASATTATNQATASASSATEAFNSASAAATSETNAAASATTAINQATASTNSATEAGASATAASNSASIATTQATASADSATAAETSAKEAASSVSQSLPLAGGSMLGAINETYTTMASAATMAIGAAEANFIVITGTTTVAEFDTTAQEGTKRTLFFTDALTVKHSSSLYLPEQSDITVSGNDFIEFTSAGSAGWWCSKYQPTAGYAVLNSDKSLTITSTAVQILRMINSSATSGSRNWHFDIDSAGAFYI
jgi:hypothetical protein